MATVCDVLRSLQKEVGSCNGSLPSSSGSDQEIIHVLAVDDSLVDRKVIERLLRDSSCKVTAVESGTRALQYLGLDDENKSSVDFNDLKVNLIMTDYSMPGMTGYELLKRIKESSAFREIPVVVMSSENIVTHIDRCLEEGAEEFIVKPVKLSDVKRLKDSIMKGEENHEMKRTLRRKIQEEACSLSSALVSLSQTTSNDSLMLPDCNLVPYESQSPSISTNIVLSKQPNHVQINV